LSARLLLLAWLAGAAAVRTYDFFEGEDLLHDLGDEVWIRCADLDRLDARWAASRSRSDLVVSLTTIPSRLPFLPLTLKSLLRQTVSPARIRLNLPAYSRREAAPYQRPEWLTRLRSVTVVDCDDLGPATKLLPTLLAVPPDQPVLAVDDDRIYPASLVADLERALRLRPEAALGLSGWIVPEDLVDRPTSLAMGLRLLPPAPMKSTRVPAPVEVDVLQGFSGYLVRPRYFDLARLADYSPAPPAAYFVDDVWTSAHCRAPKYVIPTRRTNHQSKLSGALFRRTSLGRLNRGGGDPERRNNTIMLKYFASAWRVGGRRADARRPA
jgi:hypothetical protein